MMRQWRLGAVTVAILGSLGLASAGRVAADVVLLDEYWTPEVVVCDVSVTEVDTQDTGDPTQAKFGEFSALLENASGWPSVRFRGAAMLQRADMPADRSEISLWYRTDACEGPWRIEIWQHWDELTSAPRKVMEAWVDGGGEGGKLVPDNEWHQASGALVPTEDYDDLPEDVILPTYVWISPTDGWDVAHRTYVDRIELTIQTDAPTQKRPAPEPVRHIRPRPGEQVTGEGWVWWEGEDAVEHNWPPGGIFRPCTAEQQAKLSNGAWLQHPNGAGRTARWEVEVPEAGRYALWLRGFWFVAPLRWRWNDGDWHDSVSDDVEHLDWTRIRQEWLNNTWAKLADVDLPAGKNVLELLVPPTGQNSLAIDCWLLTQVPFTPHGNTKPGEDAEAAQ
jgi:hypothetical protein